MVSAWYMDKSDSDQRDEHKCDPHRPLSLEELKKKTGVLYFPVSDCMAALANNTEMHNVSPPAYSVRREYSLLSRALLLVFGLPFLSVLLRCKHLGFWHDISNYYFPKVFDITFTHASLCDFGESVLTDL